MLLPGTSSAYKYDRAPNILIILLPVQALKEGRLRAQALQPDERMRRPGLSTLVLDEADLMLSMPGYEEDLQAVAPLVPPAQPCPACNLRLPLCLQARSWHVVLPAGQVRGGHFG